MRLFILLCIYIRVSFARECPSHGCLMLPRDVVFDAPAREALADIRRSKNSADLGLETLQTSGNAAHATLTLIGYKGGDKKDQINQDRAFVVNPFLGKFHLSGVYDGHGHNGEIVSEYALIELPKRLAAKLELLADNNDDINDDHMVVQAIKDTFLEISMDAKPASQGMGGCTASIILQMGTRLLVANAGDSISIVATFVNDASRRNHNHDDGDDTRDSYTHVHFVTREDKPHLPEERDRIERMGGRVWIPPDLTVESSRVIAVDPQTGMQSGLAMSRSIGDWDMIGVVAEPLVEVFSITALLRLCNDDIEDQTCKDIPDDQLRGNVLVVSATDGMMDFLGAQEIAESFANAFFQGGLHPLNVAEDLIYTAAKAWDSDTAGSYRDDIAVAASVLMST